MRLNKQYVYTINRYYIGPVGTMCAGGPEDKCPMLELFINVCCMIINNHLFVRCTTGHAWAKSYFAPVRKSVADLSHDYKKLTSFRF